MANSVDPDQKHSVASDLGLHCLQSLSVPILRVIMVSRLDTLGRFSAIFSSETTFVTSCLLSCATNSF